MPNLHSFETVPTKKPQRSTFLMPYNHTFTLNEGALYPFLLMEVMDFDTLKIRRGQSIRNLQTQVHCVEDDAFCDVFYFFVPKRILWKHFINIYGDGTPDDWTDPVELIEPGLYDSGEQGVVAGSVANGLGLPVGTDVFGESDTDDVAAGQLKYINAAPLAGFSSIWNWWFRDENLQNKDPLADIVYESESGAVIDLDDYGSHLTGAVAGADQMSSVNKYHDLFTSALPAPQKGPAVELPLGAFAPVVGKGGSIATADDMHDTGRVLFGYKNALGDTVLPTNGYLRTSTDASSGGLAVIANGDLIGSVSAYGELGSTNLVADLSKATAATVDDLIKSIALQNFRRSLARSGSRFDEVLLSQFGYAPYQESYKPELIGYSHLHLAQQQVATTAGQGTVGVDSKTSTGTLGGYSVTSDSKRDVVKSFREPGYLYGLMTIRVKHKYSQGIPRLFGKYGRYDYFLPPFDRLGEVPIPNRELFYGTPGFYGFQEAWYENRFLPSRVSGAVDPGSAAADLAAWTYGDKFTGSPILSGAFLREGSENIQKTLAGTSSVPQYIVNVDLKIQATRPMSLNSVPSTLGV